MIGIYERLHRKMNIFKNNRHTLSKSIKDIHQLHLNLYLCATTVINEILTKEWIDSKIADAPFNKMTLFV